jgi:hypothetical protein
LLILYVAVTGFGPKIIPPPLYCGERSEPWRALPVPFCLKGFFVVPETSEIPFVEAFLMKDIFFDI